MLTLGLYVLYEFQKKSATFVLYNFNCVMHRGALRERVGLTFD